MWQLTFWTYFLLIALSLAPVQRVVGCSCMLSHPQKLFCVSDYVAVVRVRMAMPVNEHEIAYNVKVNKVFKERNNLNPVDFPKKEFLWTASTDGMCGVHLKVGDTYVVAGVIIGGQVRISICGLAMRWSEVTSRQRKGFRGLYHRGCVCEIDYTPWWKKGAVLESAGRKRCLWESAPGPQDCQEKYGVCVAGPGGCSWTPSVPYKNCIKEHQRKREQQRLREP
ncbi:metalloproteinase inhibitor 3 isoform X2 [Hylaeus anthracinus]|nr:metalloproteinase inhibitor 3 isoform X2 [Hylaeus volcanicus]XP_053971973.1 metalloproteinase inhibitor 3 isoform X2 [Hylaeus volcanicus]XP_053971974.1 metalloproteinase inhibitor 3 isoform X2 [Hylaeus volcanicus]XP_053971975.1 metalloproteinase inhibitor 3 isoform X2 [Hylaeus volcanicus]XP_054001372.1 metalloproteinase inhibitor 3 isoform X2 [Hylaeus anthracinus]XP_054001373.1 metalloproteinase inhibitor 3 isoform X2 [Hylaeus anthracinus]XP_054001374.1 metalloproteinase inhibitor 3 isofor